MTSILGGVDVFTALWDSSVGSRGRNYRDAGLAEKRLEPTENGQGEGRR